MNKKIYIVVLNWNGFSDTKECLDSLKRIDYTNYEIIVVDNGSTDGSAQKIEKDFPFVSLIKNKENLGFSKGNNIGIRKAMKYDTDYILLLNNDVIVDPKFLSELVRGAETDPKIGMANPKIYYYDRPNVIWYAGARFNNIIGSSPHIGWKEEDEGQFDNKREPERLTGACMLIKKCVIKDVGYLNEDYFAIVEDSEFSIRVKRAGYKLLFVPESIIWHKVSSSSGGEDSPQNIYYSTRNTLYLIKEYYLFSLPFALMKCYLKYYYLYLRGEKEKARIVLSAVSDFKHNRKGKSEKY